MTDEHEHDHRDDHRHDDDGHGGHGHANDQGVKAMFRYLRLAPRLWRSEVNDAVVELVAPLAGERVVDVGAGLGAATMRAARAGASVVAVEPTPFMRRILAARRSIQRARRRITVVDGGAEHLAVPDASIDAVWAVNTMHHWVDADRAAREICRVLRPGGRIVLVDEDFQDPTHPEFERFGSRRHGDDNHGFSMVDAEEMGGRFEVAGLVDVQAGKRQVADRPAITITGRARD